MTQVIEGDRRRAVPGVVENIGPQGSALDRAGNVRRLES
jgi:hypothetical protein